MPKRTADIMRLLWNVAMTLALFGGEVKRMGGLFLIFFALFRPGGEKQEENGILCSAHRLKSPGSGHNTGTKKARSQGRAERAGNMKRKKWLRILPAALCAGLLTAAVGVSAYRAWEQPPVTAAPAPTAGPARPSPAPSAAVSSAPIQMRQTWPAGRKEGVYTILLVGNDDGNYNTDTIMLGRLDTKEHRLDFVSIPRDTLVNWDWEIRKINAVYWSYQLQGEAGIDRLKEQVRGLTGFEPDCYAVVDINVVAEAVDLLGGVDFDVPMDLNYDDDSQDLHIHIAAGPQHLDGSQAMGVCRYRSGYLNGDLGRIDMQHQFLSACAEQFIRLGSIPNLPKLTELLSQNMDTDLTAANIAFFLRQALLCRGEEIHFYTVPNTDDTIRGLSYTVVELADWLTLLNDCFNPYTEPITAEDLEIVYRQDGGYRCTAELKGAWYFYVPSPAYTGPETAGEEPESAPAPEPEPAPDFSLPVFTFPPLPSPDAAPDSLEWLTAAEK